MSQVHMRVDAALRCYVTFRNSSAVNGKLVRCDIENLPIVDNGV